ncbi:zinc-ribbon domain-containing protein [Methanobrevibacter sp.]|uniref:zinc-ribbon domain-containing protein n=1 Tax=Methanobrevibacter sp. TaxID=66852 RepID=UPI00386BED19
MSGKICEKCGKNVDDTDKFCPYCGSSQFIQVDSVPSNSSSLPTKKISQNNDLIHNLLYWSYDEGYIFSKTKLITILTFMAFVFSIFTGPPFAILLLGLIFSIFFYVIGFCIHKILRNDKPSKNVLEHNDYGLVEDLKNALLCWQNKNTGEFVFSKTKIFILLIFFSFVLFSSFAPTASLLVCLTIGLIFAVPSAIIGYAIHKLTNNNPTPKRVVEKPKPQIDSKGDDKKPEVQTAAKTLEKHANFKTHQSQLNALRDEYNIKEKRLRDLTAKRFEPPQLTYNKFISTVDNCTKIFNEKADSIQSIINLDIDDSKRVEDEIKSGMEVLKSLIGKIDELTDELVLNMDKSDDANVKELFDDMEVLIDSVKRYD